ncbi:hypothetical protein [Janthinobacterium agaricidamnosum]|uniref:hypothetical protein n=1 Tax=Janthinobacterium agaricidamnosum TaxID=55508 RepID=UPI0009DD6BF3|nr:hypothetical protein [Janthinobacterium agaricidamnosum]
MHQTHHPSKEQVRAYMQQRTRQARATRKPPPPPEEIRRQLGWTRGEQHHPGIQGWVFSIEMAQFGALLTVQWLVNANSFHCRH